VRDGKSVGEKWEILEVEFWRKRKARTVGCCEAAAVCTALPCRVTVEFVRSPKTNWHGPSSRAEVRGPGRQRSPPLAAAEWSPVKLQELPSLTLLAWVTSDYLISKPCLMSVISQ